MVVVFLVVFFFFFFLGGGGVARKMGTAISKINPRECTRIVMSGKSTTTHEKTARLQQAWPLTVLCGAFCYIELQQKLTKSHNRYRSKRVINLLVSFTGLPHADI